MVPLRTSSVIKEQDTEESKTNIPGVQIFCYYLDISHYYIKTITPSQIFY